MTRRRSALALALGCAIVAAPLLVLGLVTTVLFAACAATHATLESM